MKHFDSDLIRSQLHDSTTLDLFSEDEIGRIASDFHLLIWSQLDNIPVSVLFHILSHNLVIISSEDDLFSYVSSRVSSDSEYLHLLQFVHFEYLSSECVSDFLSALPDSIDCRLWESISHRLISCRHIPPVSPSGSLKAVDFPLKATRSLDGMISYLTQKHGENVHDKGIVTITSKSVGSGDVRNVADLISESYFCSKDEPGQWICWDFHEMRVRPTHYTIKSERLKSWVVESSLDGVVWTEIDRKTDKAFYGQASFAVSKLAECRFIRLTQTGRRHCGDDNLLIFAFEFFGTLLE
jgi:hypothetical protein